MYIHIGIISSNFQNCNIDGRKLGAKWERNKSLSIEYIDIRANAIVFNYIYIYIYILN
jgi:hypothetical protein